MENMLTGNLRKLAIDKMKLASYLTAVFYRMIILSVTDSGGLWLQG